MQFANLASLESLEVPIDIIQSRDARGRTVLLLMLNHILVRTAVIYVHPRKGCNGFVRHGLHTGNTRLSTHLRKCTIHGEIVNRDGLRTEN
jgi:hypothetical protein